MQFHLLVAVCLAAVSALPRAKRDANVAILRQDQHINEDGSYQWSYETENGIAAQETGEQKSANNLEAQGSFQYTDPDGKAVAVQYVANEDGFQPQGEHIPAIPEYILRAIAWNEAHPEEEGKNVLQNQQAPFRT